LKLALPATGNEEVEEKGGEIEAGALLQVGPSEAAALPSHLTAEDRALAIVQRKKEANYLMVTNTSKYGNRTVSPPLPHHVTPY